MARFIGQRIAHRLGYRDLVPGALIGAPRFFEAAASQVGANARYCSRDLHPAVRQDEQRRGRLVRASVQAFGEAERLEADLHAADGSLTREERAQVAPRLGRRRQALPVARGGADAHELPGVEAEGAELARAADYRGGLVEVEARGREGDLEWQPGRAYGAAGRVRPGERPAGA